MARQVPVALAVVAVTVGIAAWQVVPVASGSDRLSTDSIAHIVALAHHDQQGVVLAHQAAAQSPVESTRRRATGLARSLQRQARALTRILDAHGVPVRDRLVDTTPREVTDDGAVGCDIMPTDTVSKLAATAPNEFDARFSTLMERHLVGGDRMAGSVLERGVLDPAERRSIRSTLARLT